MKAFLKSLAILFILILISVGTACPPSQSTPKPTPILITNPTPDLPNISPIDPRYILHDLRQNYEPFADFYEAEIEPLDATIDWFYNPNLPYKFRARIHVYDDGNAYVELGNISINEDIAFLLAHELAALITAREGYQPLYSTEVECGNVSINLYDMVSSPIRDSILGRYGFDVTREFMVKFSPVLTASCFEPSDSMLIHYDACSYAHMVLYWQKVLDNQDTPPNIDNRFQECRPNTWNEAQNILDLVDEIGYDTWEKATTLFQRIIEYFGLGYCINVP
jgi:hypothetical protein